MNTQTLNTTLVNSLADRMGMVLTNGQLQDILNVHKTIGAVIKHLRHMVNRSDVRVK